LIFQAPLPYSQWVKAEVPVPSSPDEASTSQPGGDTQSLPPSAEAAVNELDADILLINAPIMPGLHDTVRHVLERRSGRRDKLVVVLVSSGGVADDAYRTAMVLRSYYEQVTVCVSGWCKSAATLLAISANELIFGCNGEMGPLDVQIAVKDELVDTRDSGLIFDAAIRGLTTNAFRVFETFMTSIIEKSQGAITFRTAADIAAEVTIGLMAPVFEKIDPLRLGADQRAQLIGMHYALRLNLHADNLSSLDALNMLLNGYPSHGFVIDLNEASQLFTNVKPLAGHLKIAVEGLGKLALIPADDDIICFLDGDDDDGGENAEASEASTEQGSEGVGPEAGSPSQPAADL